MKQNYKNRKTNKNRKNLNDKIAKDKAYLKLMHMIELQDKKDEAEKLRKEKAQRQATLYLWSKLKPSIDEMDLLKIELEKDAIPVIKEEP